MAEQKAPTLLNNRSTLATDPVRNFRFLVTFYPHDTANPAFGTSATAKSATLGFTSVSGMAVTTDSIPYREGGYNTTVHQIPGQTTFAPVTFQRGVLLGTSQNWKWMRELFATVEGGGTTLGNGKSFRCDIEVQVLGHPITSPLVDAKDTNKTTNDFTVMRFKIYNAWPTAVAYSDLNAGDNALFVEQMTVVHEGFDLNWSGTTYETEASSTFGVGA